MKRLALALAALLSLASTAAIAQSSPNFSYGQVPTAGQWNAAFSAKQDLLNFTPLNLAGGTMRGKLNTAASTVNNSGFALLPGIAPTSPANGDMWVTGSGFFVQVNGQTVTLINQASVAITGGTINGTPIGQTTPAAGAFTTLTATTPLPVTSGGTGASSASAARTALGAAASGANTDITSLNGPSLGAATATAPSAGDSSSRVPTTAFVTAAIGSATGAAGQIIGNLPTAISGTSTTAAVTVSSGAAADSTNAVTIAGAGYSWAVSNGNTVNGYQGGTTLPASSTIHFFLVRGTSGTGTFASTSLTPTLPTGYTYYRRIFSLRTDGSGALIGGVPVETAGGAMTFWLATATLDINGSQPGTSSRTLFTLNVPTGIKVSPRFRMNTSTGGTSATNIMSPDEPDVALPQGGNAGWTAAPGIDIDLNTGGVNLGGTSGQNGELTTSTAGQVALRSFTAQTPNIYWVTRGWADFRRN